MRLPTDNWWKAWSLDPADVERPQCCQVQQLYKNRQLRVWILQDLTFCHFWVDFCSICTLKWWWIKITKGGQILTKSGDRNRQLATLRPWICWSVERFPKKLENFLNISPILLSSCFNPETHQSYYRVFIHWAAIVAAVRKQARREKAGRRRHDGPDSDGKAILSFSTG